MKLCLHYQFIKHVISSWFTFMLDTYQNDFKCFTIKGYKTEIIIEIIPNFHKSVLLMEMNSSVYHFNKTLMVLLKFFLRVPQTIT